MKDLYAVLGIEANASPTDIRESYRKLSKKFHPDLNENDAYFENRFKEIREAYELLSDPVGRAAYDSQLKKYRAYPTLTSAEPKKLSKGSVNSKINWAFTAILLLVTSLFAYYVVKSMSPSKITKVATSREVANTTEPAVIHHKKHRRKKVSETTIAKTPAKPSADTISARTVKPSIARSLAPATVVTEKPKPVSAPPAVATTARPVVRPDIQQVTPGQSTTIVSARPAQQNQAVVSTPKAAPVAVSNPAPVISDAYIKANATGIVYMRQLNNYNSEVVGTIPGDTRVTVLEKSGNFCKISYNNKTGYVPNWTVQFR